MFDLVTVFHNDVNRAQTDELARAVVHHADLPFSLHVVNNWGNHLGSYTHAANVGAHAGDSAYIGFLNPDVTIEGAFLGKVSRAFGGNKRLVITGCRFGKPIMEVWGWGLTDWVCGAAFFVTREFFKKSGGFDEQFEWAWEETDLCRKAEDNGHEVRSIELPIRHNSPYVDSPEDAEYKKTHLNIGARKYHRKWNMPMVEHGPDNPFLK